MSKKSDKKSNSRVWRGGSRGYTLDYVREFIEHDSDSGCHLLSDEYKNQRTELKIMCKCGVGFSTNFDKFKNRKKRQCNECSRKSSSIKQMKSHKTFTQEIENYAPKEFQVLTEYQGKREIIEVKHLKCNRVYPIVAENFLVRVKSGSGCAECGLEAGALKRRLDTEHFKRSVKELVGDEYVVLGEYTLSTERIKMLHQSCNRTFNVYPNSFNNGVRCFHCSLESRSQAMMKTHEEFVEDVERILGDGYVVLSQYGGGKQGISIKHLECGETYETSAKSVMNGSGCPSCNISKGEMEVEKALSAMNLSYTREKRFSDCANILPLPFDFYVENFVLIEFDGDFHFVPARFSKDRRRMEKKLKKTQENDSIKNKFCIENEIPFIRIPIWDAHRIEDILELCMEEFGLYETKEEKDLNILAADYIVNKNWCQESYVKNYKRSYWLEGR